MLRVQHAHRVLSSVAQENRESLEYRKAEATFSYAALSVPSPDELRELVKPFMSDDLEKALDDFQRFEETGELRAIDMFDSERRRAPKR